MKRVSSCAVQALSLLIALSLMACATEAEVDTTPNPMAEMSRISVDELATAIEAHIASEGGDAHPSTSSK